MEGGGGEREQLLSSDDEREIFPDPSVRFSDSEEESDPEATIPLILDNVGDDDDEVHAWQSVEDSPPPAVAPGDEWLPPNQLLETLLKDIQKLDTGDGKVFQISSNDKHFYTPKLNTTITRLFPHIRGETILTILHIDYFNAAIQAVLASFDDVSYLVLQKGRSAFLGLLQMLGFAKQGTQILRGNSIFSADSFFQRDNRYDSGQGAGGYIQLVPKRDFDAGLPTSDYYFVIVAPPRVNPKVRLFNPLSQRGPLEIDDELPLTINNRTQLLPKNMPRALDFYNILYSEIGPFLGENDPTFESLSLVFRIAPDNWQPAFNTYKSPLSRDGDTRIIKAIRDRFENVKGKQFQTMIACHRKTCAVHEGIANQCAFAWIVKSGAEMFRPASLELMTAQGKRVYLNNRIHPNRIYPLFPDMMRGLYYRFTIYAEEPSFFVATQLINRNWQVPGPPLRLTLREETLPELLIRPFPVRYMDCYNILWQMRRIYTVEHFPAPRTAERPRIISFARPEDDDEQLLYDHLKKVVALEDVAFMFVEAPGANWGIRIVSEPRMSLQLLYLTGSPQILDEHPHGNLHYFIGKDVASWAEMYSNQLIDLSPIVLRDRLVAQISQLSVSPTDFENQSYVIIAFSGTTVPRVQCVNLNDAEEKAKYWLHGFTAQKHQPGVPISPDF